MSDSNTPRHEPEIAEVGVIARAEAERRKKGLIRVFIGLTITALVIGGLVLLGQQGALGPTIEVEEGEKESIEETNDPQCRAFIADVTALGKRFKREDARAVEAVIASEPEKVTAAREKVAGLRAELEALRADARESNLRYEESKQDLAKWFKYIDTELRLLDLRGEYHLERLEAEAKGETYVEPEPKPKRKGKIIGKKTDTRPDRTPEQKRDDAIIAIHDAFNSFRVWHTSAMHPCGAAEEGETPWTPEEAPAK